MLKKRIILLIILAFTAAALFCPAVNVLEIRSRKNHLQHYYSRAAFKSGFTISYTHSVNKGRVHDYYRTTPETSGQWGLELFQTDFVSYGAGIPEPEETPGAVFSVNGNTYSISNLNRKMDKLTMAVGIIANHSFNSGESEEKPLLNFFPAQTSIELKVKKISLAKYILGKKI